MNVVDPSDDANDNNDGARGYFGDFLIYLSAIVSVHLISSISYLFPSLQLLHLVNKEPFCQFL